MLMAIVFAALGAYCIFYGTKLMVTGRLTAKEEERLSDFSKKGARIYKLVFAVLSIIAGLIMIGEGAVQYLEEQKILANALLVKIILFVFLIALVVVYFVTVSKCRNIPDDE